MLIVLPTNNKIPGTEEQRWPVAGWSRNYPPRWTPLGYLESHLGGESYAVKINPFPVYLDRGLKNYKYRYVVVCKYIYIYHISYIISNIQDHRHITWRNQNKTDMYTHRYEHLDLLSSSLVRSKPEANDRGAVESNPRMNLCLEAPCSNGGDAGLPSLINWGSIGSTLW